MVSREFYWTISKVFSHKRILSTLVHRIVQSVLYRHPPRGKKAIGKLLESDFEYVQYVYMNLSGTGISCFARGLPIVSAIGQGLLEGS